MYIAEGAKSRRNEFPACVYTYLLHTHFIYCRVIEKRFLFFVCRSDPCGRSSVLPFDGCTNTPTSFLFSFLYFPVRIPYRSWRSFIFQTFYPCTDVDFANFSFFRVAFVGVVEYDYLYEPVPGSRVWLETDLWRRSRFDVH